MMVDPLIIAHDDDDDEINYVCFNPLKFSDIRWLHLKLFSAIQV